MTIDEVSPYLEGLLIAMHTQAERIENLIQIVSLLVGFIGFIGGILIMKIFWENFK